MSEEFEVTTDHIKLLRAAYVRWEDCEFGAPAIDCKRPYGNSSVEQDIAEILGWEWHDNQYEYGLDAKDILRAEKLHRETQTALQIFLQTGEMKAGLYRSNDYGFEWERVDA